MFFDLEVKNCCGAATPFASASLDENAKRTSIFLSLADVAKRALVKSFEFLLPC